jgi:hypothetical protein
MLRSALLASLVLATACSGDENELASADSAFAEPELVLVSPQAADWLPTGKVLVTGRAVNLTDVFVNDEPVTVEDGSFEVVQRMQRGINTIEVRGIDGDGQLRYLRESVLAGEFADPGRPVEEAVAVRVNSSGLDFAMDKAGDMLADLDLDGAVRAANPVFEDSYGLLGWDAVTVSADIGDLAIGEIALDATPDYGVLALTVTIPNLEVWIPVEGEIVGWDFSVDAWVWSNEVEVTAEVTLDTDGNGALVAELMDSDIQLYGFGYDTSLIPGEIESWLLVDTIRETIEEKILEKIEEAVPPILEEQLADLEIAFDTEIMEKDVNLEATFAEVNIDPKGLELVTDVNVGIKGKGNVTYAGYLASDGVSADVSTSADVAMALSDDLLNRILFEGWRSGLTEISLNTEDGSLAPEMLGMLKADEGSIDIRLDLPPVAIEKKGGLELQAGEIIVDLNTPGGGLGNHTQLALKLTAGVDMAVRNGELSIAIEDADLVITVRETDWGRGGSTEAVTTMLEGKLPVAMLLEMAGDLAFELPSLAGVVVSDADVDRNDSGVHTDITVNLQ